MANRGSAPFSEFRLAAAALARGTLAYHLADQGLKLGICHLFESVADYIERQEPSVETQAQYAKTLLGLESAAAVAAWVAANRDVLLSMASKADFLDIVWPLFSDQSNDKFFDTLEPPGLAIQLAAMWIEGSPYSALFDYSTRAKGTKPWGEKRRKLNDHDIIKFCESTLGFGCALVLAAVGQFLFGNTSGQDARSADFTIFLKALKYGLPGTLEISCYEYGFADRVVAQRLCDEVREDGFTGSHFALALAPHRAAIEAELLEFPRYFTAVYQGHRFS